MSIADAVVWFPLAFASLRLALAGVLKHLIGTRAAGAADPHRKELPHA